MNRVSVILGLLFFLGCISTGNTSNSDGPQKLFGWDLTYKSILEKNNEENLKILSAFIKSWKDLPLKHILDTWEKGAITSSILLEQPAFHAGEQLAFWFVETDSEAYLWRFVEGKVREDCTSIDHKAYISLIQAISKWEQLPPSHNQMPPEMRPQYFAFLSIYDGYRSKQILLSLEEFYNIQNRDIENSKHGRVIEVFKPLLGYW